MIKLILKLLNKTKYLYYVGRHDVLPPPLNAFEEKEALEKLCGYFYRSRTSVLCGNDKQAGCTVGILFQFGG